MDPILVNSCQISFAFEQIIDRHSSWLGMGVVSDESAGLEIKSAFIRAELHDLKMNLLELRIKNKKKAIEKLSDKLKEAYSHIELLSKL